MGQRERSRAGLFRVLSGCGNDAELLEEAENVLVRPLLGKLAILDAVHHRRYAEQTDATADAEIRSWRRGTITRPSGR